MSKVSRRKFLQTAAITTGSALTIGANSVEMDHSK